MRSNGSNGNGHHGRWWHQLTRGRSRPSDLSAYHRIALQLHYDLPRAGCGRSVLLVAPAKSKGCAQAGTTLAACLADQLRHRVLLVDTCPALAETTQVIAASAVAPGVSDFVADATRSLQELVLPTTNDLVHFLPAGTDRPLALDRVGVLLEAAERLYDFVLLTGGPLLSDPLSLALAARVSCVLVLVIENDTRVEDLDTAHHALACCKAQRVGMLLTTSAPSA